MTHVEQAVAVIRNSEAFSLMGASEPITLAALRRDIEMMDAEWDALDDDLEFAKSVGDSLEVERVAEAIAEMERGYIGAWVQFDLLSAAVSRDATATIH